MTHEHETPQKRSSTLWRGLIFISFVISAILLFQNFNTARKLENTPLERAEKRIAELEASGAELPPEVLSDASEIAARVNASRAAAAKREQSSALPTPLPPMPKSLTLEDIDFNSYSKGLAKFTGLKEGQSRGEAIDNVRLYFAPEDGNTIISTSQSIFERDDGAVLVFGASGLPDDSVKAEEIYLIVSGPKGNQTLAAFGSRIKCHRGENITEWQTALCP